MVEAQVERGEKALEALREHEVACAKRYEAYGERFTRLEVAVASNSKLLWWFGTAIIGGVLLINIKEWLL